MSATVRQIEEILNELAPVETAESYDNVGALVGSRKAQVHNVLVALDCTMDVVREASDRGAELIVTHHPLFFHARKNLLDEDPEAAILREMVKRDLNLISAHTNLDQTELSGSACCTRLLQLKNIRKEGNYLYIGEIDPPETAGALQSRIAQTISFPVRRYGDSCILVSTLAIAGGADDGDWTLAKSAGAQALLTGEVRHHNALAAAMSSFVLFDGGHFGTEAPLVPALAEYLQKRLDDVQCHVRVYPSQRAPFGCV